MLEVSQVVLPVGSIDDSLAFYEQALGLPLAMRDGDRYAMLRAGGVKIALAAPEERLPDQGTAPAFKVTSLDEVAERLARAAWPSSSPPAPHSPASTSQPMSAPSRESGDQTGQESRSTGPGPQLA